MSVQSRCELKQKSYDWGLMTHHRHAARGRHGHGIQRQLRPGHLRLRQSLLSSSFGSSLHSALGIAAMIIAARIPYHILAAMERAHDGATLALLDRRGGIRWARPFGCHPLLLERSPATQRAGQNRHHHLHQHVARQQGLHHSGCQGRSGAVRRASGHHHPAARTCNPTSAPQF